MSSSGKPTELYAQFKESGQQSFRSIVEFWEEYHSTLHQLPLDKYFDLLNTYARALFELGKYKKFVGKAEEIIALIMEYNITLWEGHDVLQYILIKKAAAHYHLFELKESRHLIEEVLKMDRSNKTAQLLLERCIQREVRGDDMSWRAVTVGLMLSAAIMVAFELLVVRNFIPDYSTLFEGIRIGLFIGGLTVWAGAETYHRWKVKRYCKQLINNL